MFELEIHKQNWFCCATKNHANHEKRAKNSHGKRWWWRLKKKSTLKYFRPMYLINTSQTTHFIIPVYFYYPNKLFFSFISVFASFASTVCFVEIFFTTLLLSNCFVRWLHSMVFVVDNSLTVVILHGFCWCFCCRQLADCSYILWFLSMFLLSTIRWLYLHFMVFVDVFVVDNWLSVEPKQQVKEFETVWAMAVRRGGQGGLLSPLAGQGRPKIVCF